MRYTKDSIQAGMYIVGGNFPSAVMVDGQVILSRAAPLQPLASPVAAPIRYGEPLQRQPTMVAPSKPNFSEVERRLAAATKRLQEIARDCRRSEGVTPMSALVMRNQLQRLMARDGVAPDLYVAKLADAVDHDLVMSGLASTGDLDLEYVKFSPFAFGALLPSKLPPLLFDHQPAAGSVDWLSYDHKGQLLVRATVTHPLAKRCEHFSVGAKIRQSKIHDNGTGDFFAEIISAELSDISLTPTPVNPKAIVVSRGRPSPPSQFYSHLTTKVSRLIDLTNLIREETRP
jgi:hypothetical protein